MARGIWSGVNPIGPRGVAVVRRADHGPERHNHGPFGNSVNIRNEPWCYGLSLLLAARYGLGYFEAAEEASRVLPEQLDRKQLEEFGDRHGIPRSELENRWEAAPE
jgi:hypothetical protein